MVSKRPKTSDDWAPEPPDSGWAWVVLFSGFVIQFMVIGFLASVSVYVYVWIDFFDGSAAETSLVISLCSFMVGFLSPVSGAMCTRFGPRPTAMVGGVLMTVGMLVSSQSTSILFLILSLGLFTALGMSMCVNANFAVLARYFKKRLALAMGISTAGTSIGQLAFAPLYQYLIDQYGWKGSLMIVAAFTAHTVAAGALMRPLTTKKKKSSKKRSKHCHTELAAGGNKDNNYFETYAHGVSFLNPSVFGKDNFMLSQSDITLGVGSIFEGETDVSSTTEVTENEDRIEYVDSDTWSSCSASERNIIEMNNSIWAPFAVTAIDINNHATEHRGSFIPRRPHSASMISQSLVKTSSNLSRLCRNPSFLVTLLVAIAHGFGWASTTYHLVSRAESINIEPDKAALLLTVMGGGSFIGRVLIGWIVDKHFVRPAIAYIIFFPICALATFITPLVTEFGALVAVVLLHGISNGAATVIMMMTPRLVVKTSLATSALAYMMLCWGIGEISGGALAGWFYDALESYDYSFYTAGSVMTIGSALMLAIYFLQRAKQQGHGHGHGIKISNGKGEPFEPGLNQFDPELSGSSVDDWGKVNPVFFMREGFQSETGHCKNDKMDADVHGCHPSGDESRDCNTSESGKTSRGNAEGENEESGLGAVGQILVENLDKGRGNAEESLGIENQMYGNVLPVKTYSHYEFAGENYTDVEVYEQNSIEDAKETLKTAAENSDDEIVGYEEHESGEGFEMGFGNPSYDDTSHLTNHESDSLKHLTNENESEIPSRGETPTEIAFDTVSEDGSHCEDHGVENPVYFARSNATAYFTCKPESVRSERDCADSGGNSESEAADENESEMSNLGYCGLSEILSEQSKYSMSNPKPGKDCEKPDEGNLKSNPECESTYDYELGILNPCYLASSKTSVHVNDIPEPARDSFEQYQDENVNTDGGGREQNGTGITSSGHYDKNHPDHDAEETFL